jgi:polyhydroxybutyrate depolymerase
MKAALVLLAYAFACIALACSSSSVTSAPDAVDATAVDAPSSDAGSPTDATVPWAPDATNPDAAAIVAARPYTKHVPPAYDPAQPTPLVVMFHGYGSSGLVEDVYMGLTDVSDRAGFLYVYGEGTRDDAGQRFWNATDGCCNEFGSTVDDVAYFDAIVDDLMAKYHVDPTRVFLIGHSNGAFMVHRLACDRSARVASIVSLAGAVWTDATKCDPNTRVSVLDVHGTADTTIAYDGGVQSWGGTYPSEAQTMMTWAQKNGCTGTLAPTGDTYDVDQLVDGNETAVQTYGSCPTGVDVQLWTMRGSGHIPQLNPATWGQLVWGFMSAHPKR